MDYNKIAVGTPVGCKIKCSYCELYFRNGDDYEFLFAVQKRGYPDEMGITWVQDEEHNQLTAGLVDILINKQFKEYLLSKVANDPERVRFFNTVFDVRKNELFVKPVAVDCTENVDLSQYEEPTESIIDNLDKEVTDDKKYNWLWIAAAAAALLA